MNSALMMMVALGGKMDPNALRAMINEGNAKRKLLFAKLADLLFGIVMFFFADLSLKVKKGNEEVDVLATDKGITIEDKLAAIIGGMKQTDKGNRLRELLRPLIIAAAEVLADLMAPNDMVIAMLGGGVPGLSVGVPGGAPALPGYGGPAAGPVAPAVQYEGKLIQAQGDARAYHVVNGRKSWIMNFEAFQRRGYRVQDVIFLDFATVAGIPDGPPEN